MNSIEANKITDVDKALDYIIPAAIPQTIAPAIKGQVLAMCGNNYVLAKANTMYFNDHCGPYLDFFIDYLTLARQESALVRIDANTISVCNIFAKTNDPDKLPKVSLPNLISSMDDVIWLMLRDIRNPLFRQLIDNWKMSNKVVNDQGDIFIQLLPTVTCAHLDELFRICCMCF